MGRCANRCIFRLLLLGTTVWMAKERLPVVRLGDSLYIRRRHFSARSIATPEPHTDNRERNSIIDLKGSIITSTRQPASFPALFKGEASVDSRQGGSRALFLSVIVVLGVLIKLCRYRRQWLAF